MLRKLVFLLVAISSITVSGQEEEMKRKRKSKRDTSQVILQPQSLEIPVDDMRDDFIVVDGYEGGLLIIQDTHEDVKNGEIWQFYLVSRQLEIVWTKNQVVPTGAELMGFDYSLGYFFLLFDMPRKYREFQVMVIDVAGKQAVRSNIELPFAMDLQFFEALDNGILLVGQYNFRPVALVHDILGDKPKVLPGFYNYNEQVFDLVIDEESRTFSIVLAEKMRNGKYTNRIKSFTFEGLVIEENLINPGEELNLIDGTTTNFGGGIQYMAGTYSKKTSLYSRGLYISKFVNGQQKFLKSHNYGDLSNFFAYRGDRAAKRITRKVERKKAKGKEPKFSFRLYIHDIVQFKDKNVLIAEAYYAKYSTSTSSSTYGSAFYNPYSLRRDPSGESIYRNFIGFKFTHAIVLAFDSNGEIIWDNSFRTNDITSYNLEESVAVNIQGENAVLMYLDDNEIKSKAVAGSDVIEDKTYTPIKLMKDGDKIKGGDEENQGVETWYDNYLYSYGLYRIRNKNHPRPKTRRVFLINKIQFDSEVVKDEDSKFKVSP
ncbi:MAG: hypothetical protein RIF46_08885 [Cyclobacteriaceae bacterium]